MLEKEALKILFAIPLPKRLLPFATGMHLLANTITESEEFEGEVYFATLEGEQQVAYFPRQMSLTYFDVICVGFTHPAAICDYLTMAELIDISSKPEETLLCAGGWGTINPELFANFFDIIFVGNTVTSMVALCKLLYSRDWPYEQIWQRIAVIPSLYVPHLYTFSFDLAGEITKITPKYEWVPEHVSYGTDEVETNEILVLHQDIAVITVTRGCAYRCAFCQIGAEDYRETPIDVLQKQLESAVEHGIKQLIINSATLLRYSNAKTLLNTLVELTHKHPGLNVVIGSLRADELTFSILIQLTQIHQLSNTLLYYTDAKQELLLTLAPEVGSDTLRFHLEKYIPNETFMDVIHNAQLVGISGFVLYFIVGFDFHNRVDDIISFVQEALNMTEDNQSTIIIRLTPFIPSVRTPMQRLGILGISQTWQLIDALKKAFSHVNEKRLSFNCAMTQGRYIYETLCMRSDRRIANLLRKLHYHGINYQNATLDTITEFLKECNLDLEWYMRRIPVDKLVPWHIVDEVPMEIQHHLFATLAQIKN